MVYVLAVVYYLIFTPAPEREICALWVSRIPTAADVASACPTDDLSGLVVRMVNIYDGKTYCQHPAPYIYQITTACNLAGTTLDNYRLVIVEPARPDVLRHACTIEAQHTPTRDEIAAECGEDVARDYTRIQRMEPRPAAPVALCQRPSVEPGPGLLQQPAALGDLATADDLYLLAGRLIWHGYITPVCDGGLSGYDLRTGAATPCGMDAARAAVITWQNRYDAEILAAAQAHGVPARLLKWIIMRETQFWPWTGVDGEVGLTQMTTEAIDTMLIQTAPGYVLADATRRAGQVASVRQALTCAACTPWDAAEHARGHFDTYAQALRAYYCAAGGDWAAAARLWNIKHQVEA